uniref:Uncharacterized protein n=2 Tax=Timspurckia oligopyrenoides TaxID=708627 RepID=A0A7S0ZJL8_9RHOD|mmetsp:Transcript_7561/g.13689  ORF Transcript_7561/g.13689 Transcript_7561/m.13689 type:complete len:1093 (+) Transcript_7561:82-3360(+)
MSSSTLEGYDISEEVESLKLAVQLSVASLNHVRGSESSVEERQDDLAEALEVVRDARERYDIVRLLLKEMEPDERDVWMPAARDAQQELRDILADARDLKANLDRILEEERNSKNHQLNEDATEDEDEAEEYQSSGAPMIELEHSMTSSSNENSMNHHGNVGLEQDRTRESDASSSQVYDGNSSVPDSSAPRSSQSGSSQDSSPAGTQDSDHRLFILLKETNESLDGAMESIHENSTQDGKVIQTVLDHLLSITEFARSRFDEFKHLLSAADVEQKRKWLPNARETQARMRQCVDTLSTLRAVPESEFAAAVASNQGESNNLPPAAALSKSDRDSGLVDEIASLDSKLDALASSLSVSKSVVSDAKVRLHRYNSSISSSDKWALLNQAEELIRAATAELRSVKQGYEDMKANVRRIPNDHPLHDQSVELARNAQNELQGVMLDLRDVRQRHQQLYTELIQYESIPNQEQNGSLESASNQSSSVVRSDDGEVQHKDVEGELEKLQDDIEDCVERLESSVIQASRLKHSEVDSGDQIETGALRAQCEIVVADSSRQLDTLLTLIESQQRVAQHLSNSHSKAEWGTRIGVNVSNATQLRDELMSYGTPLARLSSSENNRIQTSTREKSQPVSSSVPNVADLEQDYGVMVSEADAALQNAILAGTHRLSVLENGSTSRSEQKSILEDVDACLQDSKTLYEALAAHIRLLPDDRMKKELAKVGKQRKQEVSELLRLYLEKQQLFQNENGGSKSPPSVNATNSQTKNSEGSLNPEMTPKNAAEKGTESVSDDSISALMTQLHFSFELLSLEVNGAHQIRHPEWRGEQLQFAENTAIESRRLFDDASRSFSNLSIGEKDVWRSNMKQFQEILLSELESLSSAQQDTTEQTLLDTSSVAVRLEQLLKQGEVLDKVVELCNRPESDKEITKSYAASLHPRVQEFRTRYEKLKQEVEQLPSDTADRELIVNLVRELHSVVKHVLSGFAKLRVNKALEADKLKSASGAFDAARKSESQISASLSNAGTPKNAVKSPQLESSTAEIQENASSPKVDETHAERKKNSVNSSEEPSIPDSDHAEEADDENGTKMFCFCIPIRRKKK